MTFSAPTGLLDRHSNLPARTGTTYCNTDQAAGADPDRGDGTGAAMPDPVPPELDPELEATGHFRGSISSGEVQVNGPDEVLGPHRVLGDGILATPGLANTQSD